MFTPDPKHVILLKVALYFAGAVVVGHVVRREIIQSMCSMTTVASVMLWP